MEIIKQNLLLITKFKGTTMKKLSIIVLVVALSAMAFAQDATQNVTLTVGAVQKMSVSGPASLSISEGVAGTDALTSAVNNATTYNITHNQTSRKITAALDVNMPADITLEISMASTKGTGDVTKVLSTTAQDVVTAIARGADANRVITYTLSALASAGEFSGTRTVSFTIVAN